jgi:hypothetical protein
MDNRVTSLQVLDGHRLKLSFEDGFSGEARLSALVTREPFTSLSDSSLFAKAGISNGGDMVEWTEDIALYGKALRVICEAGIEPFWIEPSPFVQVCLSRWGFCKSTEKGCQSVPGLSHYASVDLPAIENSEWENGPLPLTAEYENHPNKPIKCQDCGDFIFDKNDPIHVGGTRLYRRHDRKSEERFMPDKKPIGATFLGDMYGIKNVFVFVQLSSGLLCSLKQIAKKHLELIEIRSGYRTTSSRFPVVTLLPEEKRVLTFYAPKPFRCHRLFVESDKLGLAWVEAFSVNGKSQLISKEPIPVEMFGKLSFGSDMNCDKAAKGEPITLVIFNKSRESVTIDARMVEKTSS